MSENVDPNWKFHAQVLQSATEFLEGTIAKHPEIGKSNFEKAEARIAIDETRDALDAIIAHIKQLELDLNKQK